MLETSIEIGIDLFKDLIFASWKAATGFAKEKYSQNDPFGIATRKYIGGLIEKYNVVRVLGMAKPVPLKSLYVRANILEKISSRAGLRPDELAEFFDFDRRAFGQKKETVDGEIIVNRLQKFIVLGKPGAGKTTYLKFLALMMLDPNSKIEHRRLPIFITLREWADRKMPLHDFIIEQFDICGFPEARLFLERMLDEGKCLVLFDGLDEVSQEANQDEIIRQICDFTDKYADNQFVISCRVAAYNHWFERFTDVEMADFNEQQMETFIKNWFQSEPKIAEECWERLKNSPQLRELAQVPLLLTLLCIEYYESNDFPPNRAELYERAIETLLTKWDSSRRIRRSEVYKQLSIKRKESMFARIAYHTFLQNEYFIRERTLAKMIEKYIENLPGFDPAELEPDSRAVLRSIEAHHGIFVERAKDVFSFSHLTFQEYFTAKYIVDNQWKMANEDCILDENGWSTLLEIVVEKHLYNPKWREIFVLISCLTDSADELLLIIQKNRNLILEDEGLNNLLKLVGLISSEGGKYPKLSLKIYCLMAIVFCFFDKVSKNPDDSEDSSQLRLSNLINTKVLGEKVEELLTQLSHFAVIVCLDIQRTSIEIDDDIFHPQRKGLIRYAPDLDLHLLSKFDSLFFVNQLIVDIARTPSYITNHIREKLLHEMFLPKEDLEGLTGG